MGNRFAYGMTPQLAREMKRAGSPRAWFVGQLSPSRITDDKVDAMEHWWVSVNADAATLWERDLDEVEDGWAAMANYARWCLLRRIYSHRQVLEAMTEFWEHHLYVPIHDDGVFTYRADYGKLLRNRALGRFDEMLVDAITHPAMGISLDNAQSTKRGVNENLGRELLELHTVGVGNYSEDDVKNSARLLTGYRVDVWDTWDTWYDPGSHATGSVKVLDFTHPNKNPDGREATRAYLTYLAHHPLTAQRLAQKLAVRFVSDTPSKTLVDRLAGVYLAHDTAIKPVLLALIDSDEFKRAQGSKVRTPSDDVVATHRVLQTRIGRPNGTESAANTILWQTANLGQMPFDWPRPDGPPDQGEAWTAASRMLASFETHWAMSGGWWPKKDMAYQPARHWVPEVGMRLDQLVDHLSRVLLGRASTATLLKACCLATQAQPNERITSDHPILRWRMPELLTTLLDSPDHMSR